MLHAPPASRVSRNRAKHAQRALPRQHPANALLDKNVGHRVAAMVLQSEVSAARDQELDGCGVAPPSALVQGALLGRVVALVCARRAGQKGPS